MLQNWKFYDDDDDYDDDSDDDYVDDDGGDDDDYHLWEGELSCSFRPVVACCPMAWVEPGISVN